jgi:integrase
MAEIDPQRDWTEWKVLLREAGVRDARLHDARHTAATLLLTQGVDVRVAMAILGHSSSQLTRDTYQHVVPELARDAMDLVGSALWRQEVAVVPSDRKNR